MKINEKDWHSRAICPVCRWHGRAPDGSPASLDVTKCPRCGAGVSARWQIRRMRRTAAVRWYLPWTWTRPQWESQPAD